MIRMFLILGTFATLLLASFAGGGSSSPVPAGRRKVVFWHFWTARYKRVVEEIARRFNQSQAEHFVEPVAIVGSNLETKFFLAVAGGSPPDVMNQDDQVVPDWAHRGVLTPLDALLGRQESDRLERWLYPVARKIGSYEGRLFALANGLDIRALFFNRELFREAGLDPDAPPRILEELDAAAEAVLPPGQSDAIRRAGYLPDHRRLWIWGTLFGGRFYDPDSDRVTANDPRIVAALEWMVSYSRKYGVDRVAAFHAGNRQMTGTPFPFLYGRFAMQMGGQWRVGELEEAAQAAIRNGERPLEYGVVPLPAPEAGVPNAGWANGNFFVIPQGARNPEGAWAFMKFWSGFGGHADDAARICTEGGWIPVSQEVAEGARFQNYLDAHPTFRPFVELAGSPQLRTTPSIPVQAYFFDRVNRATQEAMYLEKSAQQALDEATTDIQRRLDAVRARQSVSQTRAFDFVSMASFEGTCHAVD